MTLLNPVPEHLVIKKKISISGSGTALLKLDVWRGRGCGGQGRFSWLGWGGSAGFDQWVSDVMADSFRGKLQGLTSLVPGMPVVWFNFLDRHLSNVLLNAVVGRTLDSGATSPPLMLWAPLQDFVGEVPLVSFLAASWGSGAVQPLLSLIAVGVSAFHEWPSLTSLCFELAQGRFSLSSWFQRV